MQTKDPFPFCGIFVIFMLALNVRQTMFVFNKNALDESDKSNI